MNALSVGDWNRAERTCDDARSAMSTPAPLAGPPAYNVSVQPSRLAFSAGSGWDGAMYVQVTTARHGEVDHAHGLLVIEHRLSPLRSRPVGGPGGWSTRGPGATLSLPGDRTQGEWQGETRWQYLFVTPERAEAVLEEPWDRTALVGWNRPALDIPFAEELLAALACDRDAGYPAGPLVGDALVVALLSHLGARTVPAPGARMLGRRVETVCEYIEAHLERPLRLAELAAVAGVGVRQFGAMFKAATGWSPHRYVLRRRIERAKTLMGDPRLSLGAIAQAVGFASLSQFSRVFRQHMGTTARSYRHH